MAESTPGPLDSPAPRRRALRNPFRGDAFGKAAEGFARFMGTPAFLVGMTLFCAIWLSWNSLMPESAQFDPRALNFTLLTLILSLQASYAAPLLLLAQNRQDDRDRVQAEQDRQSNERNHATTDFITREIASLRLALNDVATRDFVRGELRDLLEELEGEERGAEGEDRPHRAAPRSRTAGPADARQPSPVPDARLRAILREELAAVLAERSGGAVTMPEGAEAGSASAPAPSPAPEAAPAPRPHRPEEGPRP
ncbi:DUF1003 domain-containing protein [Brachybacterium phenoliresistens]|uniref:DUF1003 domain-containing protein n=1 Tax=Brachybacterium phenoliresistens TaxID=396014 RepID=Z9JRP1_9MICO|nr:DUF1003 domain-containing protein [Brachybacterium phenoliresistens]EWS80693.1 hypothetical protein BF93_02250 [Brachybacterium phenoliresistens]